ncbi:hypothetical protein JAAARDRAFT_165540 [Jaapia argillacea MUCL 33604]|uniref:F-box domain-containing protein n=1 Tax=Jaapia argillacea MUCL 33604 TaxID=933084 RepID=A0A067P3R1_9AGAM|nr:hypothetical protein JAAARDRAFT_165540 [Jaapia argillacea MUCL 33604]
MTTVVQTSIHRVLFIPELLDLVFSYLDHSANANNACVCKQWSEIALDTLWKSVDDIGRLFALLAPVIKREGRVYKFTRTPEASDWKRFTLYARRVRCLSLQDRMGDQRPSTTMFDIVARTRTTFHILPNLHHLTWITTDREMRNAAVIFMHEKVTHFLVSVSTDEPHHLSAFFQDVASRMPNLTHLDLQVCNPGDSRHPFYPVGSVKGVEAEVGALLRDLPKLEKVIFPNYWITSKIMEQLSSLEVLEVIQFEFFDQQGWGLKEDVQDFNPHLEDGSFPTLWDLSVTCSLSDITRFITAPFAPAHLTCLYVASVDFEIPTSINQFITSAKESSPCLTKLYINTIPQQLWHLRLPALTERVTLETLEPLFSFTELTTFEISHVYPLAFSQEDVEAFATRWKAPLDTLTLNNEPLYPEKSLLTLRALLPFAAHCPSLKTLGLYMDATAADLPSTIPRPFENLSLLSVGVSSIQEVGPITIFLSRLCPLACGIEYGATWGDDFPFRWRGEAIVEEVEGAEADPDEGLDWPEGSEGRECVGAQLGERAEKWREVEQTLPLLIKSGMEDRLRTKVMQEEIEDLRMRTGVLMDMEKVNRGGSCIIA